MSGYGTGWPITARCAKCKAGRDFRDLSKMWQGTNLARTGRTRPYNGGNQYRCRDCGHVGWSRHVDIARKPLEADVLTLKEIGQRINAHLKRFEADPKINVDRSEKGTGLHDYYRAGAAASGKFVYVQYIGYQGNTPLTKAGALKYLAWLDAGNVGKHWPVMERARVRRVAMEVCDPVED